MGKRNSVIWLFMLLIAVILLFSACGGSGNSGGDGDPGNQIGSLLNDIFHYSKETVEEDESLPDRDNTPLVLINSADGLAIFEGHGAAVDYSNASEGYIMARYDGENPKVKIRIKKDDGETYTYDVAPNEGFAGFPLSDGNGAYTIIMYLNIEDDLYSQACAEQIYVEVNDEFSPFLRPNQYSNFTGETLAVAKGAEVAQSSKSSLKVIERAFIYITENVEYDYHKAANVQSGYIPDVDDTLTTGMGICFDYASLMTCMLRSQGIPCKLVVGYAGPAYHAWISVYVEGIGWVANMIQFNGDTWTLMDPTFAAGGDRADPNLVGDGETYNPVYYY